jgi:hypothetical protein
MTAPLAGPTASAHSRLPVTAGPEIGHRRSATRASHAAATQPRDITSGNGTGVAGARNMSTSVLSGHTATTALKDSGMPHRGIKTRIQAHAAARNVSSGGLPNHSAAAKTTVTMSTARPARTRNCTASSLGDTSAKMLRPRRALAWRGARDATVAP